MSMSQAIWRVVGVAGVLIAIMVGIALYGNTRYDDGWKAFESQHTRASAIAAIRTTDSLIAFNAKQMEIHDERTAAAQKTLEDSASITAGVSQLRSTVTRYLPKTCPNTVTKTNATSPNTRLYGELEGVIGEMAEATGRYATAAKGHRDDYDEAVRVVGAYNTSIVAQQPQKDIQ